MSIDLTTLHLARRAMPYGFDISSDGRGLIIFGREYDVIGYFQRSLTRNPQGMPPMGCYSDARREDGGIQSYMLYTGVRDMQMNYLQRLKQFDRWLSQNWIPITGDEFLDRDRGQALKLAARYGEPQ